MNLFIKLRYFFILFFVFIAFWVKAETKDEIFLDMFKSDWGGINDGLRCKVKNGQVFFNKKLNKFTLKLTLLLKNRSPQKKKMALGPYEIKTRNGPPLYIYPNVSILQDDNNNWTYSAQLLSFKSFKKTISISGGQTKEILFFFKSNHLIYSKKSMNKFKLVIICDSQLRGTDFKGTLESGEFQLSPDAIKKIQEINEKLLNNLDKNSCVRREASRALKKLEDKHAVEPLIKVLKNKDGNSEMRCKAVIALGNIGDKRAFEPLVNALKDKDNNVRREAARALGKLGDKRAVEPLIKVLKDKNWFVRLRVARALWYLRDKRAVEPLIIALKDKNSGVRDNVATVLGNFGDKRAIEPLVNTLKDKDSYVRFSAAIALGDIGDKRALEPLVNALKDKDNNVRVYAANALGIIGDKRAVEPLIIVLKDKDSDVRQYAARALGKLGDKRAIEPLETLLKIEKKSSVIEEIEKTLKTLRIAGSDKRIK